MSHAFWLREMVKKKPGREVSKDYLYDLLHRHDWRKVMPRPSHPEADVERRNKRNLKKIPGTDGNRQPEFPAGGHPAAESVLSG